MLDLSKIKGFERDIGNLDKSYLKHGITPKEAEEVFTDKNLLFQQDIKHSEAEKRFIAIGFTNLTVLLFNVFTIRKSKIRIISSRRTNKKEKKI